MEELVGIADKPYDDLMVTNQKRKVLMTEERMETLVKKLYTDAIEFNRSMSSPYGSMYEKHYFRLHPSNILAHISTETPYFLELNPEGFSIDLIPLFLDEMGLELRPLSLEQMLITGLKPSSLTVYNFTEVIRKKKSESRVPSLKENEISSILSWLLTVDYLDRKLLSPSEGQSVLELALDPELVYSSIDKKETTYLSEATFLWLEVY